MSESKFLQYQDANGDGLIDVCGDLPDVNEEFCPGCIPNPCAITPIWQNRRKWEPFLNEKICKYQITKGTPRTTTFINEAFDYKGYRETLHVPQPSKWNCFFCPFKEDDKLCNVLGKNL